MSKEMKLRFKIICALLLFVVLASTSFAEVVASRRGKSYHNPTCRFALVIKPENKITFKSEEEARRAGYAKCKTEIREEQSKEKGR